MTVIRDLVKHRLVKMREGFKTVYPTLKSRIMSSQKKGKTEPRPQYEIEVIIKTPGANIHKKVRKNELNFNFNYDDQEYEVRENSLYQKRSGFLEKFLMHFIGIRAQWLILFWEGEEEPISNRTPSVSPRVLARVRTSQALAGALKEMFSKSILENKTGLFLALLVFAVGLIIVRYLGYI